MKSGNLNFLEPSEPLQACNGTALPLYSINWLVFVTESECVYCAVRAGYLNVIQVMCFVWIWEQTAIISLYNINWLVFITETECVYCAVRTGSLNVIQVMCFVWISEQTAIISLYSTNWLVFITETECVYCAVRTGSLYIIIPRRSQSVMLYKIRHFSRNLRGVSRGFL